MERHNKKWDNDEIKKIFDEFKNDNNDIENIALELKRTPNAVNEKLYQILNLLINIIGIDINIISNIIKISSENIIERLNKYNKNEINTIKINTNENNINENDTIKINTNEINTNEINEIILNKKQEKAFNEFTLGKNVFITGPGGTGKSFVINKIIQYCKDNDLDYLTKTKKIKTHATLLKELSKLSITDKTIKTDIQTNNLELIISHC
jgi:FlaA1/EpsC-like NDP-sugar epimerase